MNDFYKIINDIYPDCNNIIATIIEGEHFGEKLIFTKGRLIYESKEDAFSKECKKFIEEKHTSGMLKLDDQRIFSEILGSEKKLVICGGGHVSIPIINIGKLLGFHVTVIEDRIQYADNARRMKADVVICDDFSRALGQIIGDSDTYFVIVTRGHRYDQACLEEIIQKDNAYIGMIGSKTRVKCVKELLLDKGVDEKELDKLYSPIGIKIGAETPEEIAISIMAEIIQVKNQGKRSFGYPKEILKAIWNEETKDTPKILATIISRKGSAPREVGTKMLIYMDGTTVGTIGGGCVEADVCSRARYQLMNEDKESKVYTVDMTGRDAEEEGMVCGGVVEILTEWV